MRKYMYVFGSTFKTKSTTIFDTLLSMIGYIIMSFVLVELWSYVYGAEGYSVINGFSMSQTLWHLVVAEFITSCIRGKAWVKSMSADVKSGAVAYKLNKPYDYYTYSLVSSFSEGMWIFAFYLPLCFILGGLLVGDFSVISLVGVVPSILTCILSVLLSCVLYSIIGLSSFWVEDATPFSWILQKVCFMCGLLFPVEFLPEAIRPIIYYSPIYGVYSGPSRLIANFSWEQFGLVVLSQVAWIVVLYIIGRLIFSRAKRKVNVNGG